MRLMKPPLNSNGGSVNLDLTIYSVSGCINDTINLPYNFQQKTSFYVILNISETISSCLIQCWWVFFSISISHLYVYFRNISYPATKNLHHDSCHSVDELVSGRKSWRLFTGVLPIHCAYHEQSNQGAVQWYNDLTGLFYLYIRFW